MEEQEIEVVVVAVESDALLPLDEGEASAQFEEEALDLPEDRRLEVLLAVGVREPQEGQHVRIAEDE